MTKKDQPKSVLHDVASSEEMQETLALLEILALGQKETDEGQVTPAGDVLARLRLKYQQR